jgi:putative oxidoreductase
VDSSSLDLALLASRVWIAFMVFMHGWRHLRAVRSGPGMANWFESLGLKPGWLHAQMVTGTELALPALLVLGFLTPVAYGGVCALMIVAFLTNHLRNGFFLNTSTEGYEYVVTVAVVCITLGTVGPGEWSLDHALDFAFPFDFTEALLITAAIGIGGAALFLLTFWRPPKRDAAS